MMSSTQQPQPVLNCDDLLELIPAYAFGLASPEEQQQVESGLTTCPEAAAQLADYRRVQDGLREAVPQMEPPPALEDRLMAAIAAETPVRWRMPQIHRAWWVTAAAVVALVFSNMYWISRSNNAPPKAPDTNSHPILLQGDSSFVLTSSREIRWVRLPAAQKNTDATAVLMWNVESETGLLYVRGFPPLSAGKTFQLWLTMGDNKLSAGTFQVDESGSGALLFNVTAPIDEYTWARITEEPEQGSSEPGDAVVVVGEL